MRRAFAAGAVAVVALLSAGPVLADQTGAMIVLPAEGTIDSAMDVVTSGTCTSGVTFVVAVRGEGIDPVISGNAVGNTELRVLEPALYPGHHAVPLSRTLREYFTSNGVGAPSGTYDLVFACRNRLDMADLQTFTATIRIDKSGAYRALGEAAIPLEEFLAAQAADTTSDPDTQPGQGADPADTSTDGASVESGAPQAAPSAQDVDTSATPETGGEAGAGAVDGAETTEMASPEMTQTASTANTTAQDNTWRYGLIALGALLLAGAGYMGWKARHR